MNLADSAQEAVFRAEAREFLETHAPAFEEQGRAVAEYGRIDNPEQFAAYEKADAAAACAWQLALFDGGWAGISWPKEFGGRGESTLEEAIFAEEQARFSVSNKPLLLAVQMVGPTLMAHGSVEQRERHLQRILSGQEVWCQLYSEPGAGSDLASLRTRAVRDGDHWVLNGQKVWTSSARAANWGILLARTDIDVPKHLGISYFIVDMRTPGIDVRPLRQASGAYHFNEVFLDDVRVPASDVVGDVGDGWRVARTTLANERTMIGGRGGGKLLQDLVGLARHSGKSHDPLVRQAIARVATSDAILRYLGLRTRTALSRGVPGGPEGSVMKLLIGQHRTDAAEAALSIEGPAGTLAGDDAPAAGDWQQARLNTWMVKIGGGTEEVQRNLLAERILGLPREQQVGRDTAFGDLPTRG